MEIKQLKELRAKAHSLEPVLQIGKSGITASIITEILLQLKKRKLIKIKLLKAAGDRKKLVDEIVSKTKAVLVRSVGRVVVLFKK
ncbi:MAG: YhbY family RNA-binding protein [Nanoarchaeota archaeon]|nr:YhbY family RNA-binding protein [Nanoarchaeota archaeon]